MALGSTYKKYGFASPDFSGLVAGQKAVGDSFKEALNGVDALLKDTEQSYIDTNTANMQDYLKKQIQDQGLGGDPIDTQAIKSKFGRLINMEGIDKTIADTQGQMETEALDGAFNAAQTTLRDTGDPLAARKKIEDTLRGQGAHENFIARARQGWTDKNASLLSDMKTEKLRADQALVDQFNQQVRESGISTAPQIKIGILDGVDKKDRSRIQALLDTRQTQIEKITPDQERVIKGKMHEYDATTALQESEAQRKRAILQAQYSEYERGSTISQGARIQLTNATKDFGSTAIQAISKELGWFNGNDVAQFNQMLNKLTDVYKIPSDEAAAMVVDAFGRNYDGGSWTGNNVTDTEIKAARKQLDNMAENYVKKIATGNTMTQFEADAATARLKRAAGRDKLSDGMYRAGQNKNVGYSDQGIREFWSKVNKAQAPAASPAPAATTAEAAAPTPVVDQKAETKKILDRNRAQTPVEPGPESTKFAGVDRMSQPDIKAALQNLQQKPVSEMSLEERKNNKDIPWYERAGGNNIFGVLARNHNSQVEALNGSEGKLPSINERAAELKKLSPKARAAEYKRLEPILGKYALRALKAQIEGK